MLSELFERLPEVGDPEQPKLVFFFDEAHLLFNEAPGALVERVELVVRLVRSKGVGVFFVTQNPLDIPDTVLAQLGNRVQHALRAFTPRDQKAVKAAASTMRANPSSTSRPRSPSWASARRSSLAGREGPAERHRARLRDSAGSQLGPITPSEAQALPTARSWPAPTRRLSTAIGLREAEAAPPSGEVRRRAAGRAGEAATGGRPAPRGRRGGLMGGPKTCSLA